MENWNWVGEDLGFGIEFDGSVIIGIVDKSIRVLSCAVVVVVVNDGYEKES